MVQQHGTPLNHLNFEVSTPGNTQQILEVNQNKETAIDNHPSKQS